MSVPKKILSLVDLDAGSQVEVSVENGRLIIEPKKNPQYTLTQLLSRCRRSDLAPNRSDREWLETGPAGREVL
jgi:antitoxin component of MazEF toxin-antitoxin module